MPLGCFPTGRRVERDVQLRGKGRRLAPRPRAGTLVWAVSAAHGLGNFWPIRPGPLGPGRRAAPQAQRVKQVSRPARRYWPRAAAAVTTLRRAQLGFVRRARRPLVPRLPCPGLAARGEERRERAGETHISTSEVGRGWVRARGGEPYRASRRSGAASVPRNSGPVSQAGRKREEVGQQGVLGRGWGRRSTPATPTRY